MRGDDGIGARDASAGATDFLRRTAFAMRHARCHCLRMETTAGSSLSLSLDWFPWPSRFKVLFAQTVFLRNRSNVSFASSLFVRLAVSCVFALFDAEEVTVERGGAHFGRMCRCHLRLVSGCSSGHLSAQRSGGAGQLSRRKSSRSQSRERHQLRRPSPFVSSRLRPMLLHLHDPDRVEFTTRVTSRERGKRRRWSFGSSRRGRSGLRKMSGPGARSSRTRAHAHADKRAKPHPAFTTAAGASATKNSGKEQATSAFDFRHTRPLEEPELFQARSS